jgi:hypothetical protein
MLPMKMNLLLRLVANSRLNSDLAITASARVKLSREAPRSGDAHQTNFYAAGFSGRGYCDSFAKIRNSEGRGFLLHN